MTEPRMDQDAAAGGPFVHRRHHGARGSRATVMCLRCCTQIELVEPTQERVDRTEREHRCGIGAGWG